MSVFSIEQLGYRGVFPDMPSYELDPASFSLCSNARFNTKGVMSIFAHSLRMLEKPLADSYGVFFYESATDKYWISCDTVSVIAHNGTAQTDLITLTNPMDPQHKWNGGQFNGGIVVNNAMNIPQWWDGVAATMVDLDAWPADVTCRVIRPFKNFLMMLDVTEADDRYSNMVWWSQPADPNLPPSSWDYTDDTKLSGRQPIAQSGGSVIDGMPLGDTFVVYKADSVWGMSLTTIPDVFRIYNISDAFGCATVNGVVSFPGGHVVLTRNDVVVHQGTGEFRSILDSRAKEYLFSHLDDSSINNCFLTKQELYHEIWVCFPDFIPDDPADGETESQIAARIRRSVSCTKALTWNWDTGSIGIRDLSNVHAADIGFVRQNLNDQWDSEVVLDWESLDDRWNSSFPNSDGKQLVMVGQVPTKAFMLMDALDPNVAIPEFSVERTGLGIYGQKSDGSLRISTEIRKLVRGMFLRGTVSGSAQVYLQGITQSTPSATPVYRPEKLISSTRLRRDFLFNTCVYGYRIRVSFPRERIGSVVFTSLSFDVEQAGLTR